MLLDAQRTHGILPVSYDDDVHPYGDTLVGRVDAVLLDNVLAARSMSRHERSLHAAGARRDGALHHHHRARAHRVARFDRYDSPPGHGGRPPRSDLPKMASWNDDQPQLYAEFAKQNTQEPEQAPSSQVTPSSGATARPSASS